MLSLKEAVNDAGQIPQNTSCTLLAGEIGSRFDGMKDSKFGREM
jgi:hypothetical protein